MQTRLDQRMIQGGVLFAARHKREASQIGEYGSCPISAIEPEQHTLLRELTCLEIACDGKEPLTQFLPVAPVAFVPKTAEPLEAVRLTDDGARRPLLPACARCSQGHRPHSTAERMEANLRSLAALVVGPLHACHPCQTRPRHCLFDPQGSRFVARQHRSQMGG